MNTAYVNAGFSAGRPLIPSDRLADVVDHLKSAAPNFYAASYFGPRHGERVMVCADAVWCAEQLVSGNDRSEEVGNAMAGYAKKFSQESYMSRDPLATLTAITTLGCPSVRRTVLDNEMGNEISQCLRSAVIVGRLAQRHAAAKVVSRYALDAAEDFCDGSMLLGAVSALTEVLSTLRAHRNKLDRNYDILMVGTLRSLAGVARYVGRNEVSARAIKSLRTLVRLDEVGPIRAGAMEVATVVDADPRELHCGPVAAFGPVLESPMI